MPYLQLYAKHYIVYSTRYRARENLKMNEM